MITLLEHRRNRFVERTACAPVRVELTTATAQRIISQYADRAEDRARLLQQIIAGEFRLFDLLFVLKEHLDYGDLALKLEGVE